MSYFPQLVAPCAHGQFIVSDVFVGVQPRRGHARRHHWAVRRNAVSGASLLRTSKAYALAVCLRGGQHLTVEGVRPQQVMAAIELLGHAPANPLRLRTRRARLPLRVRCRQGRLVIMPDRVLLRARLPLFRQPRWMLPRNVLSGASVRMLPGARMLHDVTLHTNRGDEIRLERMRPDDALRVVVLLGYVNAPAAARAAAWQASRSRPRLERVTAEAELFDPFEPLPSGAGIGWRTTSDMEEALEPAGI